MKRITAEEFENLPIKGKGSATAVFNAVLNLKPGEAIIIARTEWQRKKSPSTMCRYIEKRYGMKFTCGALTDGSGWAVKRLPAESRQ